MKRLLLIPAVVLVVAGCGGGGKSSSQPMTPQQMASKIGCTFEPNTGQTEMFVREEGDCSVNGHDVTLYTFSSTSAQNSWTSAANTFGLGPHVSGDLWVASVDDSGVAATVQSKLGGKLG
jgi:hypothetical protein